MARKNSIRVTQYKSNGDPITMNGQINVTQLLQDGRYDIQMSSPGISTMLENDQASPRSNNLMENKAKTEGEKPKKSLTKNTLVSIERMEDYC